MLLLSEIFPPEPGGSGRWFYESYRRISKPRCYFAVGHHPRSEAFDQANSDLGILRLDLQMRSRGITSVRNFVRYARRIWNVRKLVRSTKVRQIHAGRPLSEGLIAKWVSASTGVPFLCYVHGEDISVSRTSRELAMLTSSVLRSATLIIANSNFTRTLLEQDWDVKSDRVHTIHPGVDTNYFLPAQRSSEIRAKLGWGDRPVILSVGRLQARKGHDVLLRAVQQIGEAIPNVLCAIVGDGAQYSKLVTLASELGICELVQFHRELSDEQLLQCYQQCDLFCLPNRQIGADVEGFGMVLLEAQACAKPVIAGMSGGTSETMLQSETGMVIDCTQPDGLAKLSHDLLANESRRMEMGRQARKFICDTFDWRVVAERSSQLFDQLV